MADFANFAEVAEFYGDVGERIGRRSGEGELFGVFGAEEAGRVGNVRGRRTGLETGHYNIRKEEGTWELANRER